VVQFARPIIPFARLSPEWNRGPSALLPGFAPRRYQQRTPREGQAHGHWPGITPSNSLDLHLVDPLAVWDFVSHLLGHPVPPRNWALLAVGLPAHPRVHRTLVGFPCSPRMRHGWGWVASIPRERRCPHGQDRSLTAARRIAAACPCLPGITTRPGESLFTRHQQGFTVIHPMPSLPFACNSQTEWESLGFLLSFTPSRAGPGHACQGRDGRWTLARITSTTSVEPPST
jgi:hypothetical protein